MTDEIETYLSISPNKFEIYLFDKKNLVNLYKEQVEINSNKVEIDINLLKLFLEENIFKIEKLIGKFIKNIFLILNDSKVLNLHLGIKKKNYNKVVNKKYLENILIEAKDLFKETYQENQIMHMVVNKYIINGNYYSKLDEESVSDFLCIELQFISVPNNLASDISRVLEKYQIKVVKYFDYSYIKNFFFEKDIELSHMVFKIKNGFNENEVVLVPKNYKKFGFFEKFFQLFS